MIFNGSNPYLRTQVTNWFVRTYCSTNSGSSNSLFSNIKNSIGNKLTDTKNVFNGKQVTDFVKEAKDIVSDSVETVVEGAKGATQGARERIEITNQAIGATKTAITETAQAAKKMFQVVYRTVAVCGGLFALGIAAESTAKIFESYARIRKALEDVKNEDKV